MRSAGLFDLQVNGFAGIDFNAETIDADQLDHALEAMLATGVTSCLPDADHGARRRAGDPLRRARSRRGAKPPRPDHGARLPSGRALPQSGPRATPDATRPTP